MLVVVIPLALLGVASCVRRPRTALLIAVAQVFTAVLTAGLFLGECRYRVPWDGFFLLPALEGARWLLQLARSGVRAQRAQRHPRAGGAPALSACRTPPL